MTIVQSVFPSSRIWISPRSPSLPSTRVRHDVSPTPFLAPYSTFSNPPTGAELSELSICWWQIRTHNYTFRVSCRYLIVRRSPKERIQRAALNTGRFGLPGKQYLFGYIIRLAHFKLVSTKTLAVVISHSKSVDEDIAGFKNHAIIHATSTVDT